MNCHFWTVYQATKKGFDAKRPVILPNWPSLPTHLCEDISYIVFRTFDLETAISFGHCYLKISLFEAIEDYVERSSRTVSNAFVTVRVDLLSM